ncbi:MAG: GDSL-type esterase/lipase family protein [Candidatus Pseudobacter hemicellulosilyticus]|uniref:GDSL-type esterase/lipase family protein n=1 Tax=Candidatus Pseudobacter hemicellulosilyticus TaxID=3121375 RepID=A0AAJ5WSN4_9BACT|nr:MAG: GDSL-type esterase/lipase family protein [Pseudobacter sp.]
MKKFIYPLVALCLMAFITPQQKERIIFFGDSITQAGTGPSGYITILGKVLEQKGLADKYELIGAGIGGNKIYDLYLRVEEDVLAKKPNTVVIWVGVNDVWHKQSSGTGTDADKFEKFYTALIKKLQAQNIKVILCTPAAIGERTDFTNQLDGDLNKYAQLIRNLAAANKTGLVDLRKTFLDYNLSNNPRNEEKGILTSDRVHLNDKGNNLVAEEMFKGITK